MKYRIALYLSTLICMAALDMLWLKVIAAQFYQSRIGFMLEFHAIPAVLFYLMYIAGVLVFVSDSPRAISAKAVAIYGAMFGFVAYGTYDLTNLATLHSWSNDITVVDMAWGTFNTALSATVGWRIAKAIASQGKAPL